jgi:hypothetical protein
LAKGRVLGQPKREREQEVTLPIRVELNGCMVIAQVNGQPGEACDLAICHEPSGTEYILQMDAEQNVALAELMLKGKPASFLAILAKNLTGLEVTSQMPEAA